MRLLFLIALLVIAPLQIGVSMAQAPVSDPVVRLVEISGVIGPATADIWIDALNDAQQDGVNALVVRLDTPGGLDNSMRRIIKAMLASEVPVIVHVAPDGARAASAGVFLLYAAHVSAMAPGTNLGAAHPVAMGGQPQDETMMAKVTNDAVAYIRSLAALRGRNAEWAEQAVRESVSITAHEAQAAGVVDLVKSDTASLLMAVDGRTVRTVQGDHTLVTAGASVEPVVISFGQALLATLANPNVAYVLMMLGMYGMIYELSNPGLILPGIVGAISLILAFYAFSALPVSYAGVALIVLAMALFVSEFFVVGFGLLTAGGVVALLLGSIMLVDSDVPFLQISWAVILPVTLASAGFGVLAAVMAVRAHRGRVVSGEEGLIGTVVQLDEALAPEGRIFLYGESWQARCDRPAEVGDRVRVTGFDGLTVLVTPVDKGVSHG
jgi:membrane-bound serine protease (ClpP class)